MQEFFAFLRAVARHWIFLMSGAISIVLAFVERIFHWPIPNSVYWTVAAVCLLACCFLAWRDEYRLRPSIFSELQEFIKTGHSCRIEPIVPHLADELFQPLSATPQLLKLRVNRTQGEAVIPVQRIKEFLHSAGYRTLILDGRLQWITRNKTWQFFPEAPETEYGVPKTAQDARVQAIKKGLEEEGLQVFLSQGDRLAIYLSKSWQIVYDDDGRYVSAGDQHSKMILIAGK